MNFNKHKDKWLHAAVGAGIGLLALAIPALYVFLLSLFVAFGKELYDMVGNGTPEMADVAATVAGTAVVLVFFNLAGLL